jgi:hypothetical protein
VDGIERLKGDDPARRSARPAPGGAGAPSPAEPAWRRFPTPEGGGVQLTLSAPDTGFVGSVDSLFVQGIFRSDVDRRALPAGLRLERPALPVVVRFHNGRLDPGAHRADVTLLLVDEADEAGERYAIRYGLYGMVSPPRLVLAGEEAGVPAPAPTRGPP